MKILYTAFKGKNNTSYQVASCLNGAVLLLTNSFHGLERDINTAVGNYDVVYMLGVDKSLKNKIKIETCAEYNGERIFTTFNILETHPKAQLRRNRRTIYRAPRHHGR